MYSKYRISNKKCNSKLTIVVFQMNSISLIESENFRETSSVLCDFIGIMQSHAEFNTDTGRKYHFIGTKTKKSC